MQKKVFSNMVANVLGKMWSMLASYIFLPIYLDYLGEDLYGLVVFSTTLQAMLFVLGMGLSATLRKEFAVPSVTEKEKERKYKLLRSIELVYALIAFIIMGICFIGAGFIATRWLKIGTLDVDLVKRAIYLMGIAIACHLMSDLYSGGMLGIGQQVKANMLQVGWSATRAIGAVFVLALVKVDILLFLSFQIMVDLVYMIVLRAQTIKQIGLTTKSRFFLRDIVVLKGIWRYAVGVLGISIITMCNTQLDKLLVSKYFELSSMTVYNVAYSLAQIPNTLVTAIMVAVFNELVFACSQKQKEPAKKTFCEYYLKISLLSTCVVAYMLFFVKIILEIWTRKEDLAGQAYIPAMIILVGSWFLTYQSVPYYFCLANNNTKFNNYIGIGGVLGTLTIMPMLARNYGLVGVALSYAVLMLIETIVLNIVTFKRYIGINFFKWFVCKVLPTILAVGCLGWGAHALIERFVSNLLLQLICAIVAGMFTLVIFYYILFIRKFSEKNRRMK